MPKLVVRVSFNVEVEIDSDIDYLHFYIEENSCPGTGLVGAAVDKLVNDVSGVCLMCNPAVNGENKILSIDGALCSESSNASGVVSSTQTPPDHS